MNINANTLGLGFGSFATAPMLKSTQERLERMQERDGKVNFYENQIAMLQKTEGETLEDISRKLELFHSYKDSIEAAKKEYNYEQMFHTNDEAKERGEKIAEEAEKTEPKSAEERKEDMVEEALGTDEEKGELTEELEELADVSEELLEKQAEAAQDMNEQMEQQMMEELTEQQAEENNDLLSKQQAEQYAAYKTVDYYV